MACSNHASAIFKNLDQCQSLKLMLELHTAKLDSLCADGTKLSKKKQYLGQTKFEYSIGISVSIQIYVKQCIFPIGTCRSHKGTSRSHLIFILQRLVFEVYTYMWMIDVFKAILISSFFLSCTAVISVRRNYFRGFKNHQNI